jgi:hypothetical protein
VLVLEQAESFFGAELRDAGKVLDPKAIQNLGSLQVARTQTQWALNGFGRRWWSSGHGPRRRHSFCSLSSQYTNRMEKASGFALKSSVTHLAVSSRFSRSVRIFPLGARLTIRELIEEQRRRMNSANPAERLAAALLIPGELTKRLNKLDDHEIGQLLDDEVGAKLNLFAPESTVCDAAVTRLRRRAKGLSKRKGFGIRRRDS